jgi:rhodanese-related sulfurtransferase
MPTAIDIHELDELLASGATILDVLPEPEYRSNHLPGARNVPLAQMTADAIAGLDPRAPTVVYCFDYQCDLSPRAAARLEDLGFSQVYDFAAGFAAWVSDGRPTEGAIGDRDRVGPLVRRDLPRFAPDRTTEELRSQIGQWELAAVVDDAGVLLGIVRADALTSSRALRARDLIVPGPGTVRPDARVPDMARQLDRDHLDHTLVTTYDGRLIGLLRRGDLDVGR